MNLVYGAIGAGLFLIIMLIALAIFNGETEPKCIAKSCRTQPDIYLMSDGMGNMYPMPMMATYCVCLEYASLDAGENKE